ncbi:hypothetical protein CYY_001244 [Polysphondylium violaceum]|uniref:BOS complex subunit TMEM147 n=1 Tax=Polysphondylium violaceum TaxID=133409 RepID=A0A8J4Q9M9_9MYCE|nr:hypothetical protein CYY_001244 [Polysphondylium violaceum]
MALLYLTSCLLLTFGPYHVIYYSSDLNKYHSKPIITYGFLGNSITQLFKTILYSTFSFLSSLQIPILIDILFLNKEFITILSLIIDIAGVWITLERAFKISNNRGPIHIICVGLGWSLFSSMTYRLKPIVFGTYGQSFNWSFALQGIEANLDIFKYIVIALFLYLMALLAEKNHKTQSNHKTRIIKSYDKNRIIVYLCLVSYILFPALLYDCSSCSGGNRDTPSSLSSVVLNIIHSVSIATLIKRNQYFNTFFKEG